MIVSQPSKLKLFPITDKGDVFIVGSGIRIKNLWGRTIYLIEKSGSNLFFTPKKAKSPAFTFTGSFEYLKIHRCDNPLIKSFKVQLYCEECGEIIYTLTGKLPKRFKIKTDFYVEKDTSNS